MNGRPYKWVQAGLKKPQAGRIRQAACLTIGGFFLCLFLAPAKQPSKGSFRR